MPVTKIPKKDDFQREAFQCLGSALIVIFEMLEARVTARKIDLEFFDDEQISEYNLACQSVLKNALIQTQQAYEMHLRGRVCGVSPYLLIPDQRRWTDKAASTNIDFSEIPSVSAVDLPNLIESLCPKKSDSVIIKNFNSLRRLRNSLVHGVPNTKISEQQLLIQVAALFVELGNTDIIKGYERYFDRTHQAILYRAMSEIEQIHRFIHVMRTALGDDFFDKKILGLKNPCIGYCPSCVSQIENGNFWNEIPEKTVKYIGPRARCIVCSDAVSGARTVGRKIQVYGESVARIILQPNDGSREYEWASDEEVRSFLELRKLEARVQGDIPTSESF